jgi:Rho GDP-dissociation inhibitor
MSSAVETISCSKVDVPAGPEPEEKAKKAAVPAEHGGDAAAPINGKCGEAAPRCHEEEEEDEEDAPKVIDLGPMVSIKEQLEKDKVRTPTRCHAFFPLINRH